MRHSKKRGSGGRGREVEGEKADPPQRTEALRASMTFFLVFQFAAFDPQYDLNVCVSVYVCVCVRVWYI